ncbi:MAG: hypothetical protein RhofKO_01400 [Rhodothermales bacterium]
MLLRIAALLCFATALPGIVFAQPATLERGHAALNQGDYATAIPIFQDAVRKTPNRHDLRYLLAYALYHSDPPQFSGARRQLDEALRRAPDSTAYWALKLQVERDDSAELFPNIRQARREEAVSQLLRIDSTHVLGRQERGLQRMNNYLQSHNLVRVKSPINITTSTETMIERQIIASIGTGSPRDKYLGTPRHMDEIENEHEVQRFNKGRFDLDLLKREAVWLEGEQKNAQQAYHDAVRHFEVALASTPEARPIYRHLMRLHAVQGDFDRALQLAQTMRAHVPSDPELDLYHGLAAYRLGRVAEAQGYFQAALHAMPDADRAPFDDPRLILSPDEWDTYLPDEQAPTGGIWASMDPRFLTSENERQLEHYARLVYAELVYAKSYENRQSSWQTGQGRTYVRYGAPERDVVLAGPLYDGDPGGSRYNVWDYGDFQLVFWDFGFTTSGWQLYSPAMSLGSAAYDDSVIEERRINRVIPDRYDEDLGGNRVELSTLVSVLKGDNGGADVIVPYGIAVPYKPRRGNLGLSIQSGAFLLGATAGIVGQTRRMVPSLPSQQMQAFEETTLWIDTHQLRSQPGTYDLAVEFETSSGQIFGTQRVSDVVIPDYATSNLMLSDLVLAYRIDEAFGEPEAGTFQRDGLVIEPAPWGVYRTGQPIYVYFEAYNLSQNPQGTTRYETEAVIVPKPDDKGLDRLIRRAFGRKQNDGVSVSFQDQGTSSDQGRFLALSAAGEEPGTYLLILRVTDLLTETTVESRRTILLE